MVGAVTTRPPPRLPRSPRYGTRAARVRRCRDSCTRRQEVLHTVAGTAFARPIQDRAWRCSVRPPVASDALTARGNRDALGVERPLLEIQDLRVDFGRGATVVRAVDGLSYTLERAQTL